MTLATEGTPSANATKIQEYSEKIMRLYIEGPVNKYYIQTLCMIFFPGGKFGEKEEKGFTFCGILFSDFEKRRTFSHF